MKNIKNASAGDVKHIGWKYYNLAKKKAMEQESSWSGLLISLSIAFFVVFACAQTLNFTYEIITLNKAKQENVYKIEENNNAIILNAPVAERLKLNINQYKA